MDPFFEVPDGSGQSARGAYIAIAELRAGSSSLLPPKGVATMTRSLFVRKLFGGPRPGRPAGPPLRMRFLIFLTALQYVLSRLFLFIETSVAGGAGRIWIIFSSPPISARRYSTLRFLPSHIHVSYAFLVEKCYMHAGCRHLERMMMDLVSERRARGSRQTNLSLAR